MSTIYSGINVFAKEFGQPISVGSYAKGEELSKCLRAEGVRMLDAGTILRTAYYVFQTLEVIDLYEVRPTSLVAYEPGSVLLLGTSLEDEATFSGTFRFLFRNCSLPDATICRRYSQQHLV